jgi:hypothetical protein
MKVLNYFVEADVRHGGCVAFLERGIMMLTLRVTNLCIVDAKSEGLQIRRNASPKQIAFPPSHLACEADFSRVLDSLHPRESSDHRTWA